MKTTNASFIETNNTAPAPIALDLVKAVKINKLRSGVRAGYIRPGSASL